MCVTTFKGVSLHKNTSPTMNDPIKLFLSSPTTPHLIFLFWKQNWCRYGTPPPPF
ncbi:hypothetical protein Sjap_001069 [Stephania japonica]|uniref:Uncharacterized protein n=1 Tax=Stephania japonica TaxID=461633 RepID=A0AAP0KL12_9MAGN